MIDKSKLELMPNSTQVICMVDKDDKEVGSCTRKEMRLYNEWHRNTSVVVIGKPHDDPYIFYHLRDQSKEYCPGFLDLAFGGVVTLGESYVENALRELNEECGLNLSEEALVEIGHFTREDDQVRCHYKIYVVLFNGSENDLLPQKGEVVYIKKVKLSEVDDLLKSNQHTKSCPKILQSLRQFVSSGKMADLTEAKVNKFH